MGCWALGTTPPTNPQPWGCTPHLVAVHDPHAPPPAPIGGLEDDGEAVGVGELVGLMQGSDGGLRARDHGDTCRETGTWGLCHRLQCLPKVTSPSPDGPS